MNKRLLKCLKAKTSLTTSFSTTTRFQGKIVTLRKASQQVFTKLALWRMSSATDYNSTTDI